MVGLVANSGITWKCIDYLYFACVFLTTVVWMGVVYKTLNNPDSILQPSKIYLQDNPIKNMFTDTYVPSLPILAQNNFENNEIVKDTGISIPQRVSTVLVVLGNEPLDDNTPTIDTMKRVQEAVKYYKSNPNTLIIFSGGPTAGKTTEAKMMSVYAQSLGVQSFSIQLEEKARSTGENAIFVANMMLAQNLKPDNIYIVSKKDHLDWAMAMFKGKRTPGHVFEFAKPLPAFVTKEESIQQMETFLLNHPNNKRVLMRMKNLKAGIQGID